MRQSSVKTRLPSVFLYVILVCFFASQPMAAEIEKDPGDNEVHAIGSGAIVSGNLALAKKRAIEEASRKGLETYLLRRLGSEGVMNNFQRIIQDIIPKTDEAIENFHILTEENMGKDHMILVRIRINEKVIDEALREAGVVQAEGPPIKVLFLVSEVIEGTTNFWWRDPEVVSSLTRSELALYKVFQERGFDPINRTVSLPEGAYGETLRLAELEDDAIVTWGRLFSADVVIHGRAEIVNENEAYLMLKAVDVNEGLNIGHAFQIGEVEKDAEGEPLLTETLEKMVNRLAARMTPSIVRRVASERGKIYKVEITLIGLKSYKEYMLIRDFLQTNVSGIRSVRPSRVRQNAITFLTEFQGDKESLLERILSHAKLPLPLKPDQMEGDVIVLRAD